MTVTKTALWVIVLLETLIIPVQATDYELQQITQNSETETFPIINNKGEIAWLTGALYLGVYDGEQITENIAESPTAVMDFSDSGAVWSAFDAGGVEDIYIYNGTISNITNSMGVDETFPSVNNAGDLVWVNFPSLELIFYNQEVMLPSVVTVLQELADRHDVNDQGDIAFSAFGEIYLYRSSDGMINNISNSPEFDHLPLINNSGHVVWAGDEQAFFYDGTSTEVVSENIHVFDTGMENPVSINDSDLIVWSGYENDAAQLDIYLFENGEIQKITDDANFDGQPRINNQGSIAWVRDTGSGQEVYLASPKGQMADEFITKIGYAKESDSTRNTIEFFRQDSILVFAEHFYLDHATHPILQAKLVQQDELGKKTKIKFNLLDADADGIYSNAGGLPIALQPFSPGHVEVGIKGCDDLNNDGECKGKDGDLQLFSHFSLIDILPDL